MRFFEIFVGIVTLLGFAVTIWQIVVMGNRLKRIEEETKVKYKEKLDLSTVTSILSLIYDIQDDLTFRDVKSLSEDKLQLVILKMRLLNDKIKESSNSNVIKHYGRSDHDKLVLKVSNNLNVLRSMINAPGSLDVRFISEDLQALYESMKMIENQLKNKS